MVNEIEEENTKLKLGLHQILSMLTRGQSLSDIQRASARIAERVGWPYTDELTIDSDAEAGTVGMEGEEE
tara:strand:+ start:868 stop:1077 length:210 start_codon:yes stop_codon:yes gene_type:complete